MSKIHELPASWRSRQSKAGEKPRKQADFILENCALELNAALKELADKWLEKANKGSANGLSIEERAAIYQCVEDLIGKQALQGKK